MLPVFPEKRLSAFQDQYPDTLQIKVPQYVLYLLKGEGRRCGTLPEGTVDAAQITAVCYFKACQNGAFFVKQCAVQIVGKKIKVPGQSHGFCSG